MWMLLHFSKRLLTCQQPPPLEHSALTLVPLQSVETLNATPSSILEGQLQNLESLENPRTSQEAGEAPSISQRSPVNPPHPEVS